MNDLLDKIIADFNYPAYYFPTAYTIALEAHENDRRKNGMPYIDHVNHVIVNTWEIIQNDRFLRGSMTSMDEILSIAALHDVYEDHRDTWALNIIRGRLTSDPVTKHSSVANIITGVDAISKKVKGTEDYTDYVKRVMFHNWALIVKLGDLQHNMSDLSAGSLRDKYSLTKYMLEQKYYGIGF